MLSRLRAENAWLKMYVEILKSDVVLCEGSAVKYAWIAAPRRDYPLPDMCEVLAASISGCRAWRRGGKPAPSLVLLLVVLVLSGGGGV